MQITLVRHAQPAWVENGTGRNNPGLTELGVRQSLLLAQAARSWVSATDLFVSTMRRARKTAEPLSKALGLSSQHHDWLEEMRPDPEWEGAPGEAIMAALADARLRHPDELWESIGQAESFRALHERVWNGLEDLLNLLGVRRSSEHPQVWELSDPDRHLVFVAHGGSIGISLGLLLGLEVVPWEWERFAPAHASVTRVVTAPVAWGHVFSLRGFSDVRHLPPELVTS